MLVGFKVENFRSFLTRQTFTFCSSGKRALRHSNRIKGSIRCFSPLSKTAVVFGANGSGKSNLIAAFKTFQQLVLHSTALTKSGFAACYTPFNVDAPGDRPTEFEIDVVLEGIRYRYQVSFDSTHICFERLLVYQTDRAQRWFERRYDQTSNTTQWSAFSPAFHGPREMWRRATRPAALFLTTAAQLNATELQPLFRWFEHGLELIQSPQSVELDKVAARVSDPHYKSAILMFLRAAGFLVEDIRLAEPEPASPLYKWPAAGFGSGTALELLRPYGGAKLTWAPLTQEASGVRRLLGLFDPIVSALEHDKVLAIDDFDLNLHPLVSQHLIRLASSAKSGSQLLLVTHNTALMDLSIVGKDEIWLVDVDDFRSSHLRVLERVKSRTQHLLSKHYLRGRFGGVPDIQTGSVPAPPGQHPAHPLHEPAVSNLYDAQ
jgi:hypothetical protein